MKRFLSPILRDLVIIFFLSLTPLLWFKPGTVMVGHDNVAPLDPQVFLEGRLSTWNQQFFGQSQVLILGTIILHLVDAIPNYLGLSLPDTQKTVYVFWFFLIGVAAYFLAKVVRPKSSLFGLAAAILYQFNFFILQGWWIAEKGKFSAYVATPLLLSILLLVEGGRLPWPVAAVLNSLVLFVFNAGGLFGIPLFGGAMVVVGCFFLFFILEHWYHRNWIGVKRLIWWGVLSGVLIIATNAYWLGPAYFKLRSQLVSGVVQIGGVSGVISWADEISANTSFLNLMRLQGIPEWYDNPQHPFAKTFLTNPILVATSFLFPLLSFLAILTVREREKRRLALGFFLAYLVGLFFTAGTHPPLGFIYQFLIEKVPGFIIFRTPYFKFASSLFLTTAFLVLLFLDSLTGKIRRLALTATIVGVLLYHFPFFSGNFFSWREGFSTRLKVPAYVYDFGRWINQNPQARVLMLPPNSPDFQYSLYQWGYLSFQALPTLLSNRSVIVNNDKLNQEEQLLTLALYEAIRTVDSERIQKLAYLLGMTHFLLQRDMVTNVRSAIPLEVEQYASGIKTSGQFEAVASWGPWEIYKIKGQPAYFYLTDKLVVVSGSKEDLPLVPEHLNTKTSFMLKSEEDLKEPVVGQKLTVANCLNCPKKSRPQVVFPERPVLPGDPFYSVVLFLERLQKKPADAKSFIYHTLGISLKRISEINQMLFEQKPLTKEIVGHYTQLLKDLEDNFKRLTSFEEKAMVGQDIEFYLQAQRNFLRPNIGRYVTAGAQTILAGKVFSAIAKLENTLFSWLVPLEEENVRVYQFSIDQSAIYLLTLSVEELNDLKGERLEVEVLVDDKPFKRLQIAPESFERWLTLGQLSLVKGYHLVKLKLPAPPESNLTFMPIVTEFSGLGENVCFGQVLSGVDTAKLYQLRMGYRNDFSDNLIMFIWEKNMDKLNLITAVKLLASSLEQKTEQIFELTSGVTELRVDLCAPNLTSQRAQSQFRARLSQAVYPTLVVGTNQAPVNISVPSVRDLGPTRYEVSWPAALTLPTTLVFLERFDPWWQIKGVSGRHIKVNGYANGWVIDKPPTGPVMIEYEGQSWWYRGMVISGLALVGGAIILWRYRKKT